MRLKRGRTVLVAALIAGLALSVALSVASAHSNSTAAAAAVPPSVPNAAKLKAKYGGKQITAYAFSGVGSGATQAKALFGKFTAQTGIKIKWVPQPNSSDVNYSTLTRTLGSHSSSLDMVMLDVVWPGAFAPYLADLKTLGVSSAGQSQSIVANDTVDGHQVAMPFFGDYGLLYYRTDLLKKYGYSAPPKTWAQLTAMATKIQAGEKANNPNFYGYVFQGAAYEGLTCDALEWFKSSGAGGFVDNGKVTVNNPAAVTMMNMVKGWVGTISPQAVTSYMEEDARHAFEAGDAAFMRNWPYAYSLDKASKIGPNVAVTVLPHSGSNPSVGTVGGWQLAVSKYSKNPGAAAALVGYLTSAAVEKYNAIQFSLVPTRPSVAGDPAVVAKNQWLSPEVANVIRVTRPSSGLRAKYVQGSTIISQGLNQILTGGDVKSGLSGIQSRLQQVVK